MTNELGSIETKPIRAAMTDPPASAAYKSSPQGPLVALERWSEVAERAYPPNTLRAWRADWAVFNSLCLERDRVPMPASAETVRDFVFACVGMRKKAATIRRYVATIA